MSDVAAAAKRLHKNPDFQAVLAHLTTAQGQIILEMDPLSPHLVHAKVYYEAIGAVPNLTAQLAEENDHG